MPMTGSWAATRGRWRCPFADFAGLPLDGRVLDLGCGPGALTAELARRARPERVTAVDLSEEFVAALRSRHPGVQVIRAPAEDLPFERGCFDATLAQLVVYVMDDPVAGLREMATSFARLESATSLTAPSRWTSSTQRSRTGGSRSRSASPRRVRTSSASSPIAARHCASSAGRGCRSHRS